MTILEDPNLDAVEVRFFDKVRIAKYPRKNMATECWEWTGSASGKGYNSGGGYGTFVYGRGVRAHRFSWELHVGPIPHGKIVCHHCDNTRCVRPDHLFIGTQDENMKDMVKKGRSDKTKKPLGEQHGNAVLSTDKIQEIRRRISAGEKGYVLAEEFRVSRSRISVIKNKKAWKHVS